MIIYYLLLLTIGFAALIYGADKLVLGSTKIALKFNMPEILIGLTIVALGTSLPELIVSVMSALEGNAGIAVGNVIGSNIVNILFILGVAGIVSPLPINIAKAKIDIIISLVAVVCTLFFSRANVISRFEGFILLFIFALYLYWTIKSAMKERGLTTLEVGTGSLKIEGALYSSSETTSETVVKCTDMENVTLNEVAVKSPKAISMLSAIIWIVVGLVGLLIGGNLSVYSAKEIASSLGMSDRIIGLTIVALGTSLPELVTSLVAVRKGNADLAIGNIIGSNILNIFFILGITAVISPINYDSVFHFDFIFAGFVTLLLLSFMWIGKERNRLEKWESLILVSIYVWYIYYSIVFT